MSKSQNTAAKDQARNLSSGSTNYFQNSFVPNLQGKQQDTVTGMQMPSFNKAFGGYSDFASTGGFTPTSERQYMDQATSGVKNTYNVLSQQASQDRAKTGGLGTGGDISQMARQLAQQQSGAEQGAAVNLNVMKNQNKLAGLGGITNLFDTATGQVSDQGKQVLAALGINAQNQAEALNALTGLATSPASSTTWWTRLINTAEDTASKIAVKGAPSGD